MISASPAGTKDIGAMNVKSDIVPNKQEPIHLGIPISSGSQIGSNNVPVRSRVESDQSELSDDETCVLQVQPNDKGEYISSVASGSSKLQAQPCQVRGRLNQHIKFWETIEAPEFILNTIREGYKIPFMSEPSYSYRPNNRSAKLHSDFVSDAIHELLEGNRISEVPYRQDLHVISPLSVSVQPSGKKRLILDLRLVNQCLYKKKVKFEDHKKAREFFTLNSFMIKFDLKSGYHHLDIYPEHRKYLGFSWTFKNSVQRYFKFNVLPFGLSTAPYIFTKLMRPLVKLWRIRGFYSLVYLDDGLDFEETIEKAEYAAHHIRGDLFAAGFVVAEEKSIWDPTQIMEWLGIKWNSINGTISIADKRITKAASLLSNAIQFPTKSARELAKLVGSIISMGPVLGKLTRIMTRHCQMTVATAPDWDSRHPLDDYCLSEIKFWSENLHLVNSKYCFNPIMHNQIVYSDASEYACGALVQGENQLICHKMFNPEETSYSSTHRELIAILYSLEAFGEKLFNSRVKWFTDNQSTAKIVDVGSMKLTLHLLAYKIFSHCLENNIELSIQWIPREMNAQADFISKIKDCDDWQITREFFQELDAVWGPHTLDCFASFYNTKVERFFSRFWNPGCAGVDAFFQQWTGENCLVVPPVNIIPQVLSYMESQKCIGTLIVPCWPSASFWPLLWQRYGNNIKEYRYYKGNQCCSHGRNANSVIGAKDWTSYIIAMRISFL